MFTRTENRMSALRGPRRPAHRGRALRLSLEAMEDRMLLSTTSAPVADVSSLSTTSAAPAIVPNLGAPIINSISVSPNPVANTNFTLSATAFDPGVIPLPLQYTWSFTGPSGASGASPNNGETNLSGVTDNTTFSVSQPGVYQFQVTVTNVALGLSSTASESVTVLSGPSTTYTVNSLGDTGTGTGLTGDLRYCITQADTQQNSTIQFGVTGTITLNSALPDLSANTAIVGPGASSLTVQRSTAGGTPGFSVFTVDPGVIATISGLTIADGNASLGGGINNLGTLTVSSDTFNADSATYGGGINSFGNLTVIASTFTGNTAAFGAGIDNYNTGETVPVLAVTGSIFSNNTSTAYGGGIFNYYGSLNVGSTTFTNNSAALGSGGIFTQGQAIVTNSVFSNDTTGLAGIGGGLSNYIGQLELTDCIVSNNSAGTGGGLFNYFGTLTIGTTTLAGNSASVVGGGIYNIGSLSIDNSTLSNNTATAGGGIDNVLGSLVASNSTIYGNVAFTGAGGGLFNNGGAALLINVTVTANSASIGVGGGIAAVVSPVSLQNTLVAGNFHGPALLPIADDVTGTVTSGSSYNLIGDGTGMVGITNGVNQNQVGTLLAPINPLLGTLAYNGGPTQTVALLASSPAIDQGNNALAVDSSGNPLTTDQRGKARIYNGTVDIGAYEYQP